MAAFRFAKYCVSFPPIAAIASKLATVITPINSDNLDEGDRPRSRVPESAVPSSALRSFTPGSLKSRRPALYGIAAFRLVRMRDLRADEPNGRNRANGDDAHEQPVR